MGYTHYWHFGPFIDEVDYSTALSECRKIVRESPIKLGNWEGNAGPLLRDGFTFNGKGEDAYETFSMKAEPDRDNWFCKTGRMPYDVVVVACLCVLADRLGPKGIHVTSNGDPHEWEDGKALAEKVLGRDICIPHGVRNLETMRDDYRSRYLKEHPEYV